MTVYFVNHKLDRTFYFYTGDQAMHLELMKAYSKIQLLIKFIRAGQCSVPLLNAKDDTADHGLAEILEDLKKNVSKGMIYTEELELKNAQLITQLEK